MEEAGRWEEALEVSHLGSVPLLLSASHLRRGEQPLPHDPAATIQDDGLKSPTL